MVHDKPGKNTHLTRTRRASPERSFGVSVGAVLCAVGAYSLWRESVGAACLAAASGVVLVVLGVKRPALLSRPSNAWWRLANVMSFVNTRLLLVVTFVLLFVPIGLVSRVAGLDPLQRRRSRWRGWRRPPQRYGDRTHYSRMY